jgi:hypothetical protein
MKKGEELPNGIYKHYKGGEYDVIGIASHSESLEKMVIYKHLGDDGELWVRPLKMFTEIVIVEGEKIPRFRKINK